MIMLALSLRQPWAWLVVHGGKDIENRVWSTTRRGPILLHAAKGMTKREYWDAWQFAGRPEDMPSAEALMRGGLVGATEIHAVIQPTARPIVQWHMAEQYGYRLRKTVALPFRPLKGSLGFFRVEITDDEQQTLSKAGLLQ